MLVILLVWAPVEDWEAVDGSLDSFEKALQAVSSRLQNKAAQTAAGSVGWIFLTALKANADRTLCDTGAQRAEMLGRAGATYIGVRARAQHL